MSRAAHAANLAFGGNAGPGRDRTTAKVCTISSPKAAVPRYYGSEIGEVQLRLMPDTVHVEGVEADLLWHLVSLAPAGCEPTPLAVNGPKQRDQDTMDANELRALQGPLKKQYREQPATALTPARAETMLDIDRIVCRVRSWGGETDAGLHPATGGDGSLACSADMMLEALVPCAGVTVSAVATAMGVKLRGGRVVAEGRTGENRQV
jgi:hypothetical protein